MRDVSLSLPLCWYHQRCAVEGPVFWGILVPDAENLLHVAHLPLVPSCGKLSWCSLRHNLCIRHQRYVLQIISGRSPLGIGPCQPSRNRLPETARFLLTGGVKLLLHLNRHYLPERRVELRERVPNNEEADEFEVPREVSPQRCRDGEDADVVVLKIVLRSVETDILIVRLP